MCVHFRCPASEAPQTLFFLVGCETTWIPGARLGWEFLFPSHRAINNISPNPAVGSYYLDQSLGFHSPSTQKLFCILPAISWSFRMPFKYIVCLAPLYPRQTCTSGLWTIFLSGFSSCNHLLILFDLLLLFKANKQNLRAS